MSIQLILDFGFVEPLRRAPPTTQQHVSRVPWVGSLLEASLGIYPSIYPSLKHACSPKLVFTNMCMYVYI